MSIETFIRKIAVQPAVYWAPAGVNEYGGMTYADPVEIKVRWQGSHELLRTSDGEQIVARGELLTSTDLQEGGFLMEGLITDLDSGAGPVDTPSACRIVRSERIPLLRSTTAFVRKAYV